MAVAKFAPSRKRRGRMAGAVPDHFAERPMNTLSGVRSEAAE
jgi:hypothetical protein